MTRGLLALLVVGVIAGRAGADETATIRVLPIDADGVPMLEARIFGDFSREQIVLVDPTGTPATRLRPVDVARDTASGKLAIALVVNEGEVWMGNDTEANLAADDPSRYPGALIHLRAAIDKMSFGNLGAAGSVGMIIGYSDRARVIMPGSPLAELTGAKLGTQRNYYGKIGSELVSGLRLALAELSKIAADTRVVIVIGDGNDTNNDAAKAQLFELKKQARKEGVVALAVIYKGALSDPGHVITALVPTAPTVSTAANIETALRSQLDRLDRPTVATFLGYRPDRPGLVWNGRPHELHLELGAKESSPTEVLLPSWQPPAVTTPRRRIPWLAPVLLGLGLLGLAAATIALYRRRISRTPLAPRRA